MFIAFVTAEEASRASAAVRAVLRRASTVVPMLRAAQVYTVRGGETVLRYDREGDSPEPPHHA
jgi:hypothetical protein